MQPKPDLETDPRSLSFLDHLRENPDDTEASLVYADWLDDNGYSSLARYLRQRATNPEPADVDLFRDLCAKAWRLLSRRRKEPAPSPPPESGHRLERVRRPPFRLTYDAVRGGRTRRVELPFVVGVLADLSGSTRDAPAKVADLRFLDIDAATFDEVFRAIRPSLRLRVENRLDENQELLDVDLAFGSVEDFSPGRVAANVPRFAEVLATRRSLLDKEDDLRQVAEVDAKLSRQVGAILHHPGFQRLEASWRGLAYLVGQTETSDRLKIRVMDVQKLELLEDLERAVEFEHSGLYQRVLLTDSGEYLEEPFGLLLGDYEFGRHPEDIYLLDLISNVAAAAHAPFVAAASPEMFGLENFTELSTPRDLGKLFSSDDYAWWRSFRSGEDSRYVGLTMPRSLARQPYGGDNSVEEFDFQEFPEREEHDELLWMSSTWAWGVRVTDAFAKYGWFVRIRGVEGGGKVEGLPTCSTINDHDEPVLRGITEIAIGERREYELSNLGFLPLLQSRHQAFAVFYGASSCQKPKQYTNPEANAQSELHSYLSIVLCKSRFALWLRTLAGEHARHPRMDRSEFEEWLQLRLAEYVRPNPDGDSTYSELAEKPLGAARLELRAIKGLPGQYEIVVWLVPRFQFEGLNYGYRTVVAIPYAKP